MGITEGISDLADRMLEGFDRVRSNVDELMEPTLRLGVTGLSGAGKTVFVTALVASLLHRGRMRLLKAEAGGRIETVNLRPQPDQDLPRFAYEAHLRALTGAERVWPESTRSVSQLRLSLRFRGTGFTDFLTGPSTLHLDIVDYPGEWLLDLTLLDKDYESWAEEALAIAASSARAAHATGWQAALANVDPAASHDEETAIGLATAYRDYLQASRVAGHSALAPGRFLMPGEMEGSPALTFAPLPKPDRVRRGSLYAEMKTRFDAYRRLVAKPFFRNHFARLDRQVVLIDALGAVASGPRALADLTATMAETLAGFRHGSSSWLDRILGAKRIDRLLFAASKADHLHHSQHENLSHLVEQIVAEATRQAKWKGAETRSIALAAIRATAEQDITKQGQQLKLVRGRLMENGADRVFSPGELPSDPRLLLAAADPAAPGDAPAEWPDLDFTNVVFAPPDWGSNPDNGPPHLRLDSAIEFLIGDKLE